MPTFLLRDAADEPFKKVTGEIEDFPNYSPITLNRGTEKEVTILLKREKIIPQSVRDEYGLVEAGCSHGLAEHPDHRSLRRGFSWVPSRYIELGMSRIPAVKCVICWGQPKPDDWPDGMTAEDKQRMVEAVADVGTEQ